MPFHTVLQGECFSSLAERYGFANWRTLYDHARNDELRAKRADPNLLAPGDIIFIPERAVRNERVPTGHIHEFTRLRQRTRLRLVLEEVGGVVYENRRYRLAIGGSSIEGVTDADGLLEQTIPAEATKAELTLFFDDGTQGVWTLQLGALDPIEESSGVRSRLRNLGYPCDIDAMVEALYAFQAAEELPMTGLADEATRMRLWMRHDRLG